MTDRDDVTAPDPNKVDAMKLSLMLTELRLPTISQLWQSFARRADKEGWTAARFLTALTEHELAERDRRRIERHLREAKLLPGTLGQLAGVAGLAWVLFRTAFGGSWKDNAKWVLLFAVVWGAMIVPKATVRVVDRLDPTLAPAVVANVPIGLALFASLTSNVGDGLTRLTEQAFTLPDDLAYQRHGLIFGARLAAKTTRLEITDTVFARNIRNYARQCVFHALLLGHISADDLRESTDIWRLVTASGSPSAGASPARMFEFATRQPGGVAGTTATDREIVTCQAGAARLNAQWNAEIARAGTVFGRRIFPDARTDALARAELLAALPAAHDFLIGAARSAGEIMRQQMVLNAVHDAGEQWAAEAGRWLSRRSLRMSRTSTHILTRSLLEARSA